MINKRIFIFSVSILLLLLIPLVLMQFTNEVNWTILDFIIMGVLLIIAGTLCEMAIRKIKNNKSRLLAIVFIIIVFLLIWAGLAVGIF